MATTQSNVTTTQFESNEVQNTPFLPRLIELLVNKRGLHQDIFHNEIDSSSQSTKSVPQDLTAVIATLKKLGKDAEAETLELVLEKAVDKKAFGGLGVNRTSNTSESDTAEVLFLAEAWLQSLNSREKATSYLSVIPKPAAGTKPMTLAQKIFAQHALGGMPESGLQAGDVVSIGVDWILASELSWQVRRFVFFAVNHLTYL